MSGAFLIHLATLALTLFVVGFCCLEVFRAIRQDPKDRVLLFETIALATFFVGLVILRLVGITWLTTTAWFSTFFGATALAAYFGVRNWLRRRKRVG